ncbi:MAG: T9SS type A sorting domain-containing protein [Bacteroidia bacterium]
MKKIILLVLIVCTFLNINIAQNSSFTLSTKDARGQGPNNNFMLEAKSNFRNISTEPTDNIFDWKVIDISIPTGWEFGMCDPNNCLTNLQLNSTGYFTLDIGQQGEFKGDFVPNGISGTGSATITITSRKFPANTDTLKYTVNAWVTSVKNVSKSTELSLFPNPAKDKISVKYQTRENISIDIYNVLGSKVKNINHSGMETEINITDLKNGVYFIRFNDGNKTYTKQFTVAN